MPHPDAESVEIPFTAPARPGLPVALRVNLTAHHDGSPSGLELRLHRDGRPTAAGFRISARHVPAVREALARLAEKLEAGGER